MAALYLPNRPRIVGMSFDLIVPMARNPTRGGWHQSVLMGEPLWSAELSTSALSKAEAGAYKWLKAQASDSDQTVYVYDAERAHPLMYAPGGGWGSPVVEEVDRANSRIRLTGLASRARISDGDYGHWDDGPARRLHICGAVRASVDGEAWVDVRPPPPETATAALPVPFVMAKASAEMKVLQMSAPFKAPTTSQVSLTAVQVIRRY